MTTFLAALHYIALAVGFAGVLYRGRQMKNILNGSVKTTKDLLLADNLWGVAALLWVVTGFMRVFGTYEKGPQFYLESHWFYLKMVLFFGVVILELYPMITFIKWRIAKKTEANSSDFSKLHRLAKINTIETTVVLLIPFVATIMARGSFY